MGGNGIYITYFNVNIDILPGGKRTVYQLESRETIPSCSYLSLITLVSESKVGVWMWGGPSVCVCVSGVLLSPSKQANEPNRTASSLK